MIAYHIVKNFGMDEAVGLLSFEGMENIKISEKMSY